MKKLPIRNRKLPKKGLLRKKKEFCKTSHPLWNVYSSMDTRCNKDNSSDYRHYGGRGIKMCERWSSSLKNDKGFWNFIEDMGPRPEGRTPSGKRPAFTLERRDNNLGYSKKNCYWAPWKEQANNRRKPKSIAQLARAKAFTNVMRLGFYGS